MMLTKKIAERIKICTKLAKRIKKNMPIGFLFIIVFEDADNSDDNNGDYNSGDDNNNDVYNNNDKKW